MEIRRPESAEEFQQYYELRWRILRQPWNQPRGSERDRFDDQAEHVLACDELGHIVAVGRLHLLGPGEAQIRYMATEPAVRGSGYGRRVLEELERIARRSQVSRIQLNARESAIGFYAKMGYTVTGEGHTLFGVIPHARMEKDLQEKDQDSGK